MNIRTLGIAVLIVAACVDTRPPPPPPEIGLHEATLAGNLDAVRGHIEAGTDLNARDAYGSTPLFVAITFDRTDAARALIEGGVDLSLRNSDGATALHVAAFFGREEIVDALLEGGANRYLRDNSGNTPLDAVAAPFEDVRTMYDAFGAALAPLGLQLDYERIRAARPRIAERLEPRAEDLKDVSYAPLSGADWPVSTPEAEGLDPALVAGLYESAAHLSNLYALLVVRNGRLIAEGYFTEGARDRKNKVQSVTKSYVSALTGMALERGCLSSIDQKMMEFFPELAGEITDARKNTITIRQLLQMRAGYPWEERESPWFDRLFMEDDYRWVPHVADFELSADPGTRFGYSNFTSHILAVVLARACDADLQTWGQENLFSAIGAEVGDWSRDADGYAFGTFEISFTARDMARFGSLYLGRGEFRGERVLPAAWVDESLARYSEHMYDETWQNDSSRYLGPYFHDVGYGYQWWSATIGDHRIDYAWGHGGNLIILLDDLDMVIVTAADPQYERPGKDAWPYEGAVLNLVGRFIRSLPEGTALRPDAASSRNDSHRRSS